MHTITRMTTTDYVHDYRIRARRVTARIAHICDMCMPSLPVHTGHSVRTVPEMHYMQNSITRARIPGLARPSHMHNAQHEDKLVMRVVRTHRARW